MHQIRILTLLDEVKRRRVSSVSDPRWQIQLAGSWSGFERQAREFDGVILLDPPVRPTIGSPRLELTPPVRSLLGQTDQPVVLYTEPVRISACVSVLRRTRMRVVVLGVDDSPDMLRYHLNDAAADVTARMLAMSLRLTEPPIDARLIEALQGALLGEVEVDSVGSLASVSSMTRSALYRAIRSTELGSPLRLLQLLRIERAYRMLHHHDRSVAAVGEAAGDGKGRALRRALKALMGNVTLKALRDLSPTEFARRCTSSHRSDRSSERSQAGDRAPGQGRGQSDTLFP